MNERKYVKRVLQRFNMKECKPIKVYIPIVAKLDVDKFLKTKEVVGYMPHVPYSCVFGSLCMLWYVLDQTFSM